MKKKRKIKVPAAIYGLSNNAELQSGITRGIAPNDPSHLAQSIPTKGSVGASVGAIAQAIPGAINTLSSPFQTSTATTGREAAMQSIAGIGEGLASGAQLGRSIGGPIGGVIGGAAGAVTGLIGKKGKEASMTSFTDYDEGVLGTGLIGAFKNRKLRKRRAAVRLNAFQNREGVAATERLQNEFNEDNTEFDTDTFAYGGYNPASLAYVDDGELIATPDGQVSKVPEQGQPTDSNLINLPEGSKVLSNTLKVPGTKKTFAQLGEQMMAKNKSKYNDRFAQNSAKLNEINNRQIHNKLFMMQEALKDQKGIKSKSKEVKSFAYGGAVTSPFTYWIINPAALYSGLSSSWDNYGRVSEVNAGTLPEVTITAPKRTKFSSSQTISKKATPRVAKSVVAPEIMSDLNTIDETVPEVSATPQDIRTRSIMPTIGTNPAATASAPEVSSPNWIGAISDFATLAPIMSNLFTDRSESVQANYNPYASAIANTMGRRRYNINPLLRDIEQNRDVANYSASQQMTNTGHNMAFRLQNAIQANKAKAAARATESNVNNQYKGEYANAMNDLGKQWVNATNLNAQNRASARNIRRTGLSQLSQWAQNREIMSNQRSRDNAMLKLYDPFLQAGFTNADLTEFRKYLKKGGNK